MFCSMRDPIFGEEEEEEVFAWPGRRQGWTDTLQMTRKGSNHRLWPPGFPASRALEDQEEQVICWVLPCPLQKSLRDGTGSIWGHQRSGLADPSSYCRLERDCSLFLSWWSEGLLGSRTTSHGRLGRQDAGSLIMLTLHCQASIGLYGSCRIPLQGWGSIV